MLAGRYCCSSGWDRLCAHALRPWFSCRRAACGGWDARRRCGGTDWCASIVRLEGFAGVGGCEERTLGSFVTAVVFGIRGQRGQQRTKLVLGVKMAQGNIGRSNRKSFIRPFRVRVLMGTSGVRDTYLRRFGFCCEDTQSQAQELGVLGAGSWVAALRGNVHNMPPRFAGDPA